LPVSLALAVHEIEPVARERIPENERVRASGERDAGEVVVDAELVAERGRHRQAPGTLREQQRAVDVEEPDERDARNGHGGSRLADTGYGRGAAHAACRSLD
jgi:hypothetical protein